MAAKTNEGLHDAAERLAAVESNIAGTAREAGRAPGDINLIAVSKTFDAAAIEPVLAAGHRLFGENRVQEALGKWPALRKRYSDARLHLIGPLQSNKAKEAVALFDAIHTVDRPKIARAIAREMEAQQRSLKLFVQVNTGEEPQKSGVMPADVAGFVKLCRQDVGLEIIGLMSIPPVDEPLAPHFAFLAKLAAELELAELSMGMSADYEAAIQFGATHLRVGSAIFGPR